MTMQTTRINKIDLSPNHFSICHDSSKQIKFVTHLLYYFLFHSFYFRVDLGGCILVDVFVVVVNVALIGGDAGSGNGRRGRDAGLDGLADAKSTS